ncbi:MAG: NAD-dependent epimerase/dehydratase family protein [Saprospiraceae bacterium]|nr:NAD-dependent epimerase/dehydratase family protein [Saprospiraceae bacterium]
MSNKKETILIAGGTGLVGNALLGWIDYKKYDVILLSRLIGGNSKSGVNIVKWDPDTLTIDILPQVDHVINLAGAGIADMRWTESRKSVLVSSRVNSALTLEKYIKSLKTKPKTYISASAVGYYGDRGSEILTEASCPGDEFMSECCIKWENAARAAGAECNRTVILRIGIVLSVLGELCLKC